MEINKLKKELRSVWKSEGYDDETINQVFEFIDQQTIDGKGDWVKLPDINFLYCVRHLTDSMWHESFDEPFYRQLEKDIRNGVTFAFYLENGLLAWER